MSAGEQGLGLQAWWGTDLFDPGRVEQVVWPTQPIEKPQQGFFTSTWNGQTSAWIDWQGTQPDRASESRSVQLLTPDPGAVLYVINSPGDYGVLVEAYPQRYENPANPTVCPHWRAIHEEGCIDAIHMTADAVTHRDQRYAQRWEVGSTLWFRPKLSRLDPS